MRTTKDEPQQGNVALTNMSGRTLLEESRLDFRHASSHLNEKRPGYYLILLRNELRHRSLRDKPTLNT